MVKTPTETQENKFPVAYYNHMTSQTSGNEEETFAASGCFILLSQKTWDLCGSGKKQAM